MLWFQVKKGFDLKPCIDKIWDALNRPETSGPATFTLFDYAWIQRDMNVMERLFKHESEAVLESVGFRHKAESSMPGESASMNRYPGTHCRTVQYLKRMKRPGYMVGLRGKGRCPGLLATT